MHKNDEAGISFDTTKSERSSEIGGSDRESQLKDMLDEAILQLDSLAEAVDRVTKRLRLRRGSLESRELDRN